MIPFHQYQRYKVTEILLTIFRKNQESFKILEVGANQHKNLLKFLPTDHITFLDIDLPSHLRKDPDFVEGDATDLKFKENSFDFVIALDVFEHIPFERRSFFISETYRVSKYGVLFSAPFNNGFNQPSEKRISTYFSTLYKEETIWQKEHDQYGLPLLNDTINKIMSLNIHPYIFSHGSTLLWEKFIRMEILTGKNIDLLPYWELINKFYIDEVFAFDFDEKEPVRSFIIMPKNNITLSDLNQFESIKKSELHENTWNRILDLEQSFYNLLNLLEKPSSIMDNCQLFIDLGNGFNEHDSIIKKYIVSEVIEVSFDLDFTNIVQLRFDPTDTSCLFKLFEITGKKNDGTIIPLNIIETNSIFSFDNVYAFSKKDPNLFLEKQSDLVQVNIKFWIDKNSMLFEMINKHLDLLNASIMNLATAIEESEKKEIKLLEEKSKLTELITNLTCEYKNVLLEKQKNEEIIDILKEQLNIERKLCKNQEISNDKLKLEIEAEKLMHNETLMKIEDIKSTKWWRLIQLLIGRDKL